ncbi:MAG: hypothetical protein PHC97_00210 [Patescibacteria group bacterium]|nr:hypothetical protein [Patescibacteria group bacterium]
MDITYRAILKNALRVVWKNKILWFFGIFASFLTFGGVYEIIIGQINLFRNREILYNSVLNLYSNQSLFLNKNIYFLNLLSSDSSAYIYFILAAVLVLFFFWFAFVSQIFIIKSSYLLYRKKIMETKKIFHQSTTKFWPVLGINIIVKLILYAGFIAFSLPLFFSLYTNQINNVTAASIFLFVLFTLLAIFLEFINAYATNFVAVKNHPMIEAVKESWRLFAKNITISLEIALILFVLKIVALIIIFSLFFLLLMPLSLYLFASLGLNSPANFVLAISLIVLAFTLISVFINSFFAAFSLSTWAITFAKLSEESMMSKLARVARKIPAILRRSAINKINGVKKLGARKKIKK